MTTTELRKNLFRLLDNVAEGTELEFTHKGSTLRIVSLNRGSRLARLAPPSEEEPLSATASGWDAAARAEWAREVETLL